MKVRRPYAFCCIEGGGRIAGCGCSKPDHGFAIVDVRSPLPGDVELTDAMLRARQSNDMEGEGRDNGVR